MIRLSPIATLTVTLFPYTTLFRSGNLPVLALDVVDNGGRVPAQERRNDKTHAFARARGREGQDMLWPFVAQVLAIMLAEEYAGRLREARFANEIGRASCRERVCQYV